MKSAYNQIPLDEQSQLTQFVIGNQQYELNRLFYGVSIGLEAFSAFMSKRIQCKRIQTHSMSKRIHE